jgi:deoxycytidylate deaminase
MFSDRDLRYFDVAKAVSKTSNHSKFKIGAAIIVNKSVVAVGVNDENKSHPLQKKYNAFRFNDDTCKHSIHAEIDAIVRAKNQIEDFTNAKLFVYRLQKTGKIGNARPCKGCMQAVKDFGIKEIFYSTDGGLAYEKLN